MNLRSLAVVIFIGAGVGAVGSLACSKNGGPGVAAGVGGSTGAGGSSDRLAVVTGRYDNARSAFSGRLLVYGLKE